MPVARSNIAVSDEIAGRLSKIAEKEGKTSYSFANECLDEALSICEHGGSPDEIYSAWVMNRIGKDVGALQWIGRNVMEKLAAESLRSEGQKFLQIWFDAGFNFGVYLQICYPTVKDVVELISRLKQSFNVGRVDLVEEDSSGLRGEESSRVFTLTVVSSFSAELLKVLSEYWRGLLSAYGLSVLESTIGSGSVKIRFIFRGKLMKADPASLK